MYSQVSLGTEINLESLTETRDFKGEKKVKIKEWIKIIFFR
jgi:hypothetical protein